MSIDESKFRLFLTEFTKRYPQFSDKGELNYIFAGSFALNCYHCLDNQIQIMEKDEEENYYIKNTNTISSYNKRILKERAKPMGDLDLLFASEEYERKAMQFGINFNIEGYRDIFIKSSINYGKEPYKESISIDGIKMRKEGVCQMKLGDNIFMVATPEAQFSNKLLYTIRQLQQGIGGIEKTKDNLKDIYVLLQLSNQIHTKDDIVNSIVVGIENTIKSHEREGIALDYFTRNIIGLKQVMHKHCGDKLQEVERLFEEAISAYRKKTEIPYQPRSEEK